MAVGIIAEYNPFHAGHAYQIAEIKKFFPHDEIVVLMSGNFTQRGEPAILNKFLRANLAVKNGADLVFELPFLSAVRSAQDFARGAIKIFENLNVVDKLAFGAEISDLNFLKNIAKINLADKIKSEMSKGISYAAAVQNILQINMLPNTILAVEYLRALPEKIQPILIQRVGANYHDKTLQKFSSASAIRAEIYKQNPDWIKISDSVNKNVFDALQAEKFSGLVREDFLFRPILSKIICTSTDEMQKIFGMNEGLENLIIKSADSAKNFQDFIAKIVNKRYSASRIKRLLLNFLLDVTSEKFFEIESVTYARILAFNQRGQSLLKIISKTSDIKIISKVAPYFKKNFQENFQKKLAFDVKAANLYNILFEKRKSFFDDFTHSPQKIS